MHKKSIFELAKELREKKYSCEELVKYFLQRIKSFDKKLNSFITLTEERALKQARLADKCINRNAAPLLTGIPIAHKDLFCTQGVKTSCASKMLDNFISPYNATVVERLEQAGMIMLGKTNMDEFAMGASNETSFYGCVRNPWNLQMVPGGSSGGSAAAVAARMIPIATGSDSGGSIRQPCSFCGITGLKTTYGRISRFGMIAFASSVDQAGLLSCNAYDIALVLNFIAGFDECDSTIIDEPVPDYTANLNNSIKGLRIGLPKEYLEGLEVPVGLQVDAVITAFKKMGAKIEELSLPHFKLALPVYAVIAPAECSSNLARFDGVRYGYRCNNPVNLEDLYIRSRSEGFGEEVKRRILVGTYMLSTRKNLNYYEQAQKVRRLITEDFIKALNKVDIILGPTTPSPAYPIAQSEKAVKINFSDIFTTAASLAGLPALSMPAGFIDELPIGVQLIGNYFAEEKILNAAHQYQQVTDWHKQIPEGY